MIKSFEINHKKLKPGLYVSREDRIGNETITTLDLRFCRPNQKALTSAVAHTIEHLMADYLRNVSLLGDKIIYFGPMGCLTGFYLILKGKWSSEEVLPHVMQAVRVCAKANTIPGATEEECGNCKLNDLNGAKIALSGYFSILENATEDELTYPD